MRLAEKNMHLQGRNQDFVKGGGGAPSMDKTKGLWETVAVCLLFLHAFGVGVGCAPPAPPGPATDLDLEAFIDNLFSEHQFSRLSRPCICIRLPMSAIVSLCMCRAVSSAYSLVFTGRRCASKSLI